MRIMVGPGRTECQPLVVYNFEILYSSLDSHEVLLDFRDEVDDGGVSLGPVQGVHGGQDLLDAVQRVVELIHYFFRHNAA